MLHTSLRTLRSASVRPRATLLAQKQSFTRYSCRSYSTENADKKERTVTDDVVNKSSPVQTSESEAAASASSASTISTFSALSEPHPSSISPTSDVGPSGPSKEEQLQNVKKLIREWTDKTSYQVRKQADAYTAKAVKTFSQLGAELNKATGYEEIESLKKRVAAQEANIDAARQAAKVAKEEYDKAVSQRAKSQKEVNDLLQRKSSWTDDDVLRFTALVRQDHLYEQAEARAKAATGATEAEVEREFTELMRVILNRYHEEQIWSDKIRSVSTYGSLTVLGLNLLVFVTAILFVEPWKRRRLAQTFEKKVEEMTAETVAAFDARTASLDAKLDKHDELLGRVLETVYYANQPAATVVPPVDVGMDDVKTQFTEDRLPNEHWTPAPQWLVATTATTAIIMGWCARSWFGP
ncbi:hypothetical protein QCA50_014624 [Cerrena zonata]|uniref:Sensitive to high expression protein 9, mitochondrial n=1 Tax=Cerrena zonata TaxID=2478898 RepID=A0AAW0FVY9_9APHY